MWNHMASCQAQNSKRNNNIRIKTGAVKGIHKDYKVTQHYCLCQIYVML